MPADKTGHETGFQWESADKTNVKIEPAVQTGSRKSFQLKRTKIYIVLLL